MIRKEDRARLAKEADPFGSEVLFFGFDGNYESEHLGSNALPCEGMTAFGEHSDLHARTSAFGAKRTLG